MTDKKRGRPKSNNPKNKRFDIRMNEQQANLLEQVAIRLKLSKNATFIKGIELLDKSTKQ